MTTNNRFSIQAGKRLTVNDGDRFVVYTAPSPASTFYAFMPGTYSGHFSGFVDQNGDLYMSGDNSTYGPFGNNSTSNTNSPVQAMSGITSIKGAAHGRYHSIVVLDDGSMYGAGRNQVGQLGDGSTATRSTPSSITTSGVVESVSCGGYFSHCLKSDGSVWGWGQGAWGMLGNGGTAHKSTPTAMIGGHTFVKLDSGGFVPIMIRDDGTLWSCGYNDVGEVGDGTTTHRSSPVSVLGGGSFIDVGGGGSYHSAALRSDNTVWAWGKNASGQLGDNTKSNRSSPVSVLISNVVKVRCGDNHMLMLKDDGTVWECGATSGTSSPQSVAGAHSFIDITTTSGTNFGLKEDGSVWGWREGSIGEIGEGANSDRASPVSTYYSW